MNGQKHEIDELIEKQPRFFLAAAFLAVFGLLSLTEMVLRDISGYRVEFGGLSFAVSVLAAIGIFATRRSALRRQAERPVEKSAESQHGLSSFPKT